ncbi:Protein of unknown function [Gryllus bimaculatus]|nr:Protein of unknown function [Gryllus bimaculatus]
MNCSPRKLTSRSECSESERQPYRFHDALIYTLCLLHGFCSLSSYSYYYDCYSILYCAAESYITLWTGCDCECGLKFKRVGRCSNAVNNLLNNGSLKWFRHSAEPLIMALVVRCSGTVTRLICK